MEILNGIVSIFNSAKCLNCVLRCNYETICNMWTIHPLVLIVLWMCLLAGATILCMLPFKFLCLDVFFSSLDALKASTAVLCE